MAVSRIFIACICGLFGTASAQEYRITTVAGGGPPLGQIPALETNIGNPIGVAVDDLGNIYFSSNLNLVFKLGPSGSLSRFAGNGTGGVFWRWGSGYLGRAEFPTRTGPR